ncbi:DUF262 domain-containing protein [Halococcoides cellulosivorans]|uniref:DUF262 domain-containing protein n=1 Tax=Halococcoides cellulosivorans TaxID=1679096 RepID=A0A2R4X3X1_9EURY|nr:DUF262 domain-containing protein [Halococcoides cellulosivorans]AWB28488.1 hypothetical protein HARCEL1_12650 [Halococcoides cellulosivorans]
MEIADQISSRSMGFLFESNDQFIIPSYQRRYSWESNQVNDLWKDLQKIEGDDEDHFFGTIVFMSRSSAQGATKYDIVDGQQRITTVSILLCAIRDYLDEHFPKEDVKSRIENINESLWLVDRDNKQQGFRLLLGNLDQDSYEDLIKGHPDEVENENIVNAYESFIQHLGNIGDLEAIKEVHDRILDQLIYVAITVEQHSDAYQLFEAMNNRGLSLSPIDLMKNYLLMQASKQEVEDRIENLWGDVIENIDQISGINSPGTTFFRQYFMASDQYGVNDKITTNKLYEPTFINSIEDTSDIETLMEDIRDKSTLYRKLIEQDIDMFDRSANVEVKRLLKDAKTVSITPFTLFLRAFSKTDNVERLKRMIEKSNVLMLRRQICDRSTSPHDTMFNHLAQEMFETEDPLAYMDEYLKSEDRIPSDEQFMQYFRRESFRKTDRTKYILSNIEEKHYGQGGKRVSQSRYEVHIEHILPERPGQSLRKLWLKPFNISDDDHEEYKKRIGNLTLLESDPNIRASNRTLEEKQNYYTEEATDFKMTHELQGKERWDTQSIQKRSRRLAEIAVDIWSL